MTWAKSGEVGVSLFGDVDSDGSAGGDTGVEVLMKRKDYTGGVDLNKMEELLPPGPMREVVKVRATKCPCCDFDYW